MLLTKKLLNNLLQIWRIQIPSEIEKELLEEFGHTVVTEDGRLLEHSEQDIGEQLRKIVHSYEVHSESRSYLFKLASELYHLKGNPNLNTNSENRAPFSAKYY